MEIKLKKKFKMDELRRKLKTIIDRNQIGDLIRYFDSPTICEVGVRFGENFKCMLVENVKEALAVDIWREIGERGQNDGNCTPEDLENQYETFKDRYKDDSRVIIMREFSTISASKFKDNYFDIVYLDADHTYQSVKDDLEAWYPKIKKGGIISGHDYIDGDTTIRLGHSVRFGVVDAVQEFIKNMNIDSNNFHLTSEQYASYFIIKE